MSSPVALDVFGKRMLVAGRRKRRRGAAVTLIARPRAHAVPRVSVLLGATLICAALHGCVYLPSIVEVYDPECQVVAKHMTLQEVQVSAIVGCQNQSCVAMILAVGATTAASVIVSGSIVVVGNIAYWLERQATCRRAK